MQKPIVIYTGSDFHLFHPKTPTKKICDEIRKYILSIEDADIFIIAGDFFDRLSTIPKEESAEAEIIIYEILKWAKEKDVLVRVLEGTPSHDWKQSRWFTRINTLSGIHADVGYFDTLDIEYIKRYDLHVLYIPDEWDEPDNTLDQVKRLMISKGLEQVDIAVMHGQFHYQLPHVARAPKHNEEEYLKLVKYFITIGHVHKHSTLDRIFAQGSFSRLAHGEEEPKGFYRFVIHPDGLLESNFIENKDALLYITIDITDLSVEESYRYIEERLQSIPEMQHVRIQAYSDHPVLKNIDTLIKRYPLYRWSSKIEKRKEEILEREEIIFQEYQPLVIHENNIKDLLRDRLINKGIDSKMIEDALLLIEGG